MNIEHVDGTRQTKNNLTAEQVVEETAAAIADPNVRYIEIFTGPNRQERRQTAAVNRKRSRQPGKRK